MRRITNLLVENRSTTSVSDPLTTDWLAVYDQ